MMVGTFVHRNMDERPSDPVLKDGREPESVPLKPHLSQLAGKTLGVKTSVQEGTQDHISSGTGKTVKISNLHPLHPNQSINCRPSSLAGASHLYLSPSDMSTDRCFAIRSSPKKDLRFVLKRKRTALIIIFISQTVHWFDHEQGPKNI